MEGGGGLVNVKDPQARLSQSVADLELLGPDKVNMATKSEKVRILKEDPDARALHMLNLKLRVYHHIIEFSKLSTLKLKYFVKDAWQMPMDRYERRMVDIEDQMLVAPDDAARKFLVHKLVLFRRKHKLFARTQMEEAAARRKRVEAAMTRHERRKLHELEKGQNVLNIRAPTYRPLSRKEFHVLLSGPFHLDMDITRAEADLLFTDMMGEDADRHDGKLHIDRFLQYFRLVEEPHSRAPSQMDLKTLAAYEPMEYRKFTLLLQDLLFDQNRSTLDNNAAKNCCMIMIYGLRRLWDFLKTKWNGGIRQMRDIAYLGRSSTHDMTIPDESWCPFIDVVGSSAPEERDQHLMEELRNEVRIRATMEAKALYKARKNTFDAIDASVSDKITAKVDGLMAKMAALERTVLIAKHPIKLFGSGKGGDDDNSSDEEMSGSDSSIDSGGG